MTSTITRVSLRPPAPPTACPRPRLHRRRRHQQTSYSVRWLACGACECCHAEGRQPGEVFATMPLLTRGLRRPAQQRILESVVQPLRV